MSINISALSAFRDISNEMFILNINKMESFDCVNIFEGIKGQTTLNTLTRSPQFNNSNCNSTDSGSTVFGVVNFNPSLISDYSEYCADDLVPYFHRYLRKGAQNEELAFEKYIMECTIA